MKKIDDTDDDDSIDPQDYDETYDESEDEQLEQKKKRMGFFLTLGHIIFGLVILVLLIGAVGGVGYSMKKYNEINTELIEKTLQAENNAQRATDLEQQLTSTKKERDDLKSENEVLNQQGAQQQEAAPALIEQKNAELIQTKTELQQKTQEVNAIRLLLNNTVNRDEVVEEFRNEYNRAIDRLYDEMQKACIEAVDIVMGNNEGTDNKRDIKEVVEDKVKIDRFKAGLFNQTRS